MCDRRSSIGWCLAAITFALISGSTRGAQLAFDNASQSAYADGWQSGDNGGFGFWAVEHHANWSSNDW
jgi:hypothetical protein